MQEVNDHLYLAGNPSVQKMLIRHGNNQPQPERIYFSDFVIKVNRRDKEQTRVMLLTDKAVYNLMPNNYGKCKRRIAVEVLNGITASSTSEEFVLHVPDEYDYLFKSTKKEKICSFLVKMYADVLATYGPAAPEGAPPQLACRYLSSPDLRDKALSKAGQGKEAAEAASAPRDKAAGPHAGTVQLGDFTLLKVLGRGSFGKVLLARKISNGKFYALKVLKKRNIIKRNQVEHTIGERKILEALKHPFLMRLRCAFQSQDELFLVLDYFRGGELFFHLKHMRRFPEDVARIYVAEIGLALGHLHSLGIIYRDLKPENILLDEEGHVCLTDFGLSKDVDPNDKAHTFCGTPEYLAPEIVTGEGHDKAVDWWSLGILLYELTVGIPPFYDRNLNEMYTKIQQCPLKFPGFLSQACKALILGLLARDPSKRVGSEDDVHDLQKQPFFNGLDWDRLYKKQIQVPYKPSVQGDNDTSNFDSEFTTERVSEDGDSEPASLGDTMEIFAGFSFQDSDTLD